MTRCLRLPLAAFILCSCAWIGDAYAQCRPGDVLVMRTAEGVYCAPRTYNPAEFSEDDERLIQSMVAFGADAWERYRLDQALHTLRPGRPWPDELLVGQTWNRVRRHSTDAEVLRSAAAARGVDLFSSGWQSGTYTDCTIFALASVSGRPYGWVAAEANELIRQATWRPDGERNSPGRVFTETGGLMGGEVAILTERLGRIEVIRPDGFAATIRAGRPVLVSLAVSNEDEHQVVLSRTFNHRGQTWYEMIDSTADTRGQRRFISDAELRGVMMENGIAYQADENATVRPLR